MNESDRTKFGIVINALAASFRAVVSKPLLHGYWLGLKDLSVEDLERAAARALCESKFMPAPAELRTLAGVMSRVDRMLKAWDALQRAVEQYGCYKSVNFDDPVINAAVRNLGGWMNLDDRMKGDERKWTRKEFATVYESLCRTGIVPGSGEALIGFSEHDQGRCHVRYDLPETVQIETGLPPHGPGVVPALAAPKSRNKKTLQLVSEATAGIGN